MNVEQVVTFILFLFVVGLWLFLKISRKQNSDLPAKALDIADRVFTASRALIRVIALLLGCALWWLPLTFMPEDLEGIICMGSFGTLLILYGILGPIRLPESSRRWTVSLAIQLSRMRINSRILSSLI